MTNVKRSTIADRFLARVAKGPDLPAMIFPDVTFNFGQLKDLAASFALRFSASGVDRSKSLRVTSDDPAVALPAVLAGALLGVRVNMGREQSDSTDFLVVAERPDDDIPHIVVDTSFSPANFSDAEKNAIWTRREIEANAQWLICSRSPGDVSRAPLGLDQGTLVDHADLARAAFSSPTPRVAVLLAPTTYHGLTRRLAALLGGGAVLEMGSWQFLIANSVTDVVLPVSGVSMLTALEARDDRLGRCEVLGPRLSQGETEALLRLFHEVSVVFDTPEIGTICRTRSSEVSGRVETKQTIARNLEVTDLGGAPSRFGRVRIRANDGAHDYIYPGAVARRTDNAVELLGPANDHDLIRIADESFDAALVDGLIASTDGIAQAVAFASPKHGHDEMLAFVIFEDGVNRHQVVRRAEIACQDALGARAVPAKMRPIDRIPLRPSGSPNRSACAEMILHQARLVSK